MSAPSYDQLITAVAYMTSRDVEGSSGTCGCCADERCIFCGQTVYPGDWELPDHAAERLRLHADDCVYRLSVRHLPHHRRMQDA